MYAPSWDYWYNSALYRPTSFTVAAVIAFVTEITIRTGILAIIITK